MSPSWHCRDILVLLVAAGEEPASRLTHSSNSRIKVSSTIARRVQTGHAIKIKAFVVAGGHTEDVESSSGVLDEFTQKEINKSSGIKALLNAMVSKVWGAAPSWSQ